MSTFVGIPRIPAAAPEREMPEADRRAVRMAVSLLLDYPGEDFLEKVGAVEAELAALPDEASAPLGGLAGLDHIVLGAAGSRQAAALEEVETITRLLEARLGREVTPAYLSAARPSVRDAVSTARARGARRVGVATYLLAEGRFHRALHSTGADVVAAPIGDHPAVAELVVHRYREELA